MNPSIIPSLFVWTNLLQSERKKKTEGLVTELTEFIPTHYLAICGLYEIKDKLQMHTKNL